LSNNYKSCSLGSSSDENDDQASDNEDENISVNMEEDEEQEKKAIHYVIGDVMQPQNTDGQDAIIVHCVGELFLPINGAIYPILFVTTLSAGRFMSSHDSALPLCRYL
jgi:hypothetical protein